jgi:hypothetical protein
VRGLNVFFLGTGLILKVLARLLFLFLERIYLMKKFKSFLATTLAVLVMALYVNAQVQPKDTSRNPKPKMDTLHKKSTPVKPSTNKQPKPMDTVYRAPKPGQAPPKK